LSCTRQRNNKSGLRTPQTRRVIFTLSDGQDARLFAKIVKFLLHLGPFGSHSTMHNKYIDASRLKEPQYATLQSQRADVTRHLHRGRRHTSPSSLRDEHHLIDGIVPSALRRNRRTALQLLRLSSTVSAANSHAPRVLAHNTTPTIFMLFYEERSAF